MMRLYPDTALYQLEFDKVKALLEAHCKTVYAQERANNLRIHTHKDYIHKELRQTHEFAMLLRQAQYFPNDFTYHLQKELKLLGIPGALLGGEQWMLIRKLTINAENIFRWFDPEKRAAFSSMAQVLADVSIDEILEIFWKTHDPTTLDQQGNDIGPQYKSVVYYVTETQKQIAEKYKEALDKSGAFSAPIVTTIEPFKNYYPAENYHQNYYNNNTNQGYCRFVIAPKLEKFEKVFKSKLKH